MSNRLRKASSTDWLRAGGAALFLALICSFGCGCLAGEGLEDDSASAELDGPAVENTAAPSDTTKADQVIAGEVDLGEELAALEARYQEQLRGATDQAELELGDGDGGRGDNPDPTPWDPGAEDNPDPTPWHDGMTDEAMNPDPTPWLTRDDDDDDDRLDVHTAFAADRSGGSGWGHGHD